MIILSRALEKAGAKTITVSKSITVSQLLEELKLSDTHVVLVDGKKADLDTELNEDDKVVILPIIAGG
ncbi:MAG: hypothetical protein BAJATHORv1_30310 [Candidatus Thorarchaeota archaeon]|nr:MAG: hypothetical protein BAJATHORv1_30310 [Candidatus Thorarchaeota archaeon]